jgi:hypothetical protein
MAGAEPLGANLEVEYIGEWLLSADAPFPFAFR